MSDIFIVLLIIYGFIFLYCLYHFVFINISIIKHKLSERIQKERKAILVVSIIIAVMTPLMFFWEVRGTTPDKAYKVSINYVNDYYVSYDGTAFIYLRDGSELLSFEEADYAGAYVVEIETQSNHIITVEDPYYKGEPLPITYKMSNKSNSYAFSAIAYFPVLTDENIGVTISDKIESMPHRFMYYTALLISVFNIVIVIINKKIKSKPINTTVIYEENITVNDDEIKEEVKEKVKEEIKEAKTEVVVKTNNKVSIRLVLIIIGCIIALAACAFFVGKNCGTTKVTLTGLGGSFRDLGDLEVQAYDYTGVIKIMDSNKIGSWNVPLTEKIVIYSIDGHIKAGIDMTTVKDEDIVVDKNEDGSARKVTVNLPAITITDSYIDTNSRRGIYDLKTCSIN